MKVCVVTGVTRAQGLGYAIAKQMYDKGYVTYIGGRRSEELERLGRSIDSGNGTVRPIALDITDDASVEKFCSQVGVECGRLDALINNAGGSFDAGKQPLDLEFDECRQAFDTNLFGAWRMIRESLPLLRDNGSACVVNVSSGAASFTDSVFGLAKHPALVPAYGISKLALNGLTVKLAVQLASYGIMVNAVDPGLVATYPGMEKMGAAAPMDAAAGVVWAATLEKGGPTGKFFRNGEEIGW